jgi:single-strand DNA-binding protein
MNVIQIAGHLGADVETRFTPDGQKVSTIRVATNIRRNGKDETIWWRVSLWGDRFDKMLPYLKKGSSIIVVGEVVRAEVYTDREGRQQVSLEVRAEFLRFSPFGKTDRQQEGQHASAASDSHQAGSDFGQTSASRMQAAPAPARAPAPQAAFPEMSDDDVPF